MKYAIWAVLLVLQNASFTWVSRARNTENYLYHAIAAVFSNGIWLASQFILIDVAMKASGNTAEMVGCGALYIVSTVSGSVAMHWLCINKMEKRS